MEPTKDWMKMLVFDFCSSHVVGFTSVSNGVSLMSTWIHALETSSAADIYFLFIICYTLEELRHSSD